MTKLYQLLTKYFSDFKKGETRQICIIYVKKKSKCENFNTDIYFFNIDNIELLSKYLIKYFYIVAKIFFISFILIFNLQAMKHDILDNIFSICNCLYVDFYILIKYSYIDIHICSNLILSSIFKLYIFSSPISNYWHHDNLC